MVTIPKQLRDERFVKLCWSNPDKEKQAAEKGWPTTTNYSFEEFPNEPTYAVLCGNNNLMVIDCDTKDVQEALLQIPEIRETFTTKTASKKLYHFYFRVTTVDNEQPKGFRANNEHNERVFDLQGKGTYVLGPNSELLNKSKYEIVNPREIATIDYTKLSNILKNLLPKIQIINPTTKTKEHSPTIDFDEICVAIKNRIKPVDILPKEIQTNVGVNTSCPLGHSSEGGKCFSHDDMLWHCFHCEQSGNVIQLYMKMHSCTFNEAKNKLAEMAGLGNDFSNKVLLLYSDQKTKHVASEMIAEEIIKLNKIVTIRNDKDNEMWIYKHGIYVPHGKTYINQFVRSILKDKYSTYFSNQVAAKIETDTYKEQEDFFINEDITKVPVLNGVLDIRKKTIEPFSSNYIFFNKLPLVFDPMIKPDKTLKFIADVVKNKIDTELLQEIFGYLLHREYNIEKTFMFIGSGRNGKGKLLGLIERFIGVDNSLSLSLQEITKPNSYDTEKLFGKYVNIGGDLPRTSINDSSKLKSFSGRDSVTCMRKFLSPITFVNFAKFLFACNELPEVDDESVGYFDRWIRIDFPYKFVNEPKHSNEKKINVNILKNITSDKEMSGLLNWALEGLSRLQDNEKFTQTEDNTFTRSKWSDTASSFSAFLTSNIESSFDKADFTTTNDLNRAYNQFCAENNLVPEAFHIRKNKLIKMGAFQTIKTISYARYRGYNGIKFIDDKNNMEIQPVKEEELIV